MKYVVRIEPEGNEDNEYATPCFFHFEEIGIMMSFVEFVLTFSDGVDVYISRTGE